MNRLAALLQIDHAAHGMVYTWKDSRDRTDLVAECTYLRDALAIERVRADKLQRELEEARCPNN